MKYVTSQFSFSTAFFCALWAAFRKYFPVCLSLKNSVHLLTRYFDKLHDFSVIIPRCYKDVYVNSFFPHTAGLFCVYNPFL